MVIPRPDAPVPRPVPVVFMGSPAFAVPTLDALVGDNGFAVRLVVTQPPKPAGRGNRLARSAVHEAAERHGLPVWTPDRLRGDDALRPLREAEPTLFVVAAYGKILRPDVLNIPTHGTLNVHASLLPAYRGASPITAAILDGATETGVTIMLLDPGLDTGPTLDAARTYLSLEDTTATLTTRLAQIGAPLLVETARRWVRGAIAPTPQDETRATVTRLVRKEDGQVDWAQPAARIARMERAYTPWPGVYTFFAGARLILRQLAADDAPSDAPAGTVVAVTEDDLVVATGAGVARVGAVQPEGKATMSPRAFAAGRPGLVGMRFTSPSFP